MLVAAAAGADAAVRTAPVAVGMRIESRPGDAAGEEEGHGFRTQEAKDLTAPEHLEEETDVVDRWLRAISVYLNIIIIEKGYKQEGMSFLLANAHQQ